MEELAALFIFILGCLQIHGTTFIPCDERRLNCCAGYMLEENEGRCFKCPVGFIGPLCKTACPFPLYGSFCLSRCNCTRSECSHIEGCYLANSAAFVTQTSAVPKEEVSVKQNPELRSRTTAYMYMYIPTMEDKGVQNDDHPPSTYAPTFDYSRASSLRMLIIILVGLCILLMILYAASFGIKPRKLEHEPHLIQLEVRDNYSI